MKNRTLLLVGLVIGISELALPCGTAHADALLREDFYGEFKGASSNAPEVCPPQISVGPQTGITQPCKIEVAVRYVFEGSLETFLFFCEINQGPTTVKGPPRAGITQRITREGTLRENRLAQTWKYRDYYLGIPAPATARRTSEIQLEGDRLYVSEQQKGFGGDSDFRYDCTYDRLLE